MAHLESLVPKDRISAGESVLQLHAKDQSHHPGVLPEVVIWPKTADEVSEIVKYAGTHLIPVTGWGSGSSLEGNPIPVRRGIVARNAGSILTGKSLSTGSASLGSRCD